jgi:5-deoxy-glucuronate isomerase
VGRFGGKTAIEIPPGKGDDMISTGLEEIRTETCIVRNTGAGKGRHVFVTPQRTASRHLCYGRIVLDAGDAPVEVDPGDRETGLVCLRGGATARASGEEYALERYDALYIPRGTAFRVTAGAEGCDIAELSASVERQYPAQFVSFAEI